MTKELIKIFELMVQSRKLDEKQLILLKQGKGFFHIGASGHEAAQIAAAHTMKSAIDYAYPYYRDQAFCLAYGMTSKDMLLSFMAKEDDPNSGGRQMPQHFGHKDLNIVSQSSPTGTQFLQATGAGFALKRNNKNGVVGWDEDDNNHLNCIEFDRIKGGKPFDNAISLLLVASRICRIC